MSQPAKNSIYILLAFNMLVALFVYRDYGLSWDEPLFYDYGDALGYAYSPREWFSGSFDLENSYGASGADHKTRGPAYLFLARNLVYGLVAIGSDLASAWHLINFLFFQLGVYFLYRLATRWMQPLAALATCAFFSWQPILWGHAFINPKDPSFLVFFLGAVCLGFEMVDELENRETPTYIKVIAAAFFLGIATSIRVLGPLAGLLVVFYGAFSFQRSQQLMVSISRPVNKTSASISKYLAPFLVYIIISIVITFITWPYLWENPVARFFDVLHFMSDNPTQLSVLFNGDVYRANEMPRRYLPFMLGTTLTEPTWILFLIGLVVGYRKTLSTNGVSKDLASLTLTLSWLVLLALYVVIRQPAIYDGLRHVLFILPPIFIFIGFAFEWIGSRLSNWLRAGVVLACLLPGIIGILQLHPYEYAYYNSVVGGTSGAFRRYETDYWLTCYKDAVEMLNSHRSTPANLFVHRESYIAQYYASDQINVHSLRESTENIQSGDYILVNSRTNEDRSTFRDAPPVLQVARGDAIFCVIKQVP